MFASAHRDCPTWRLPSTRARRQTRHTTRDATACADVSLIASGTATETGAEQRVQGASSIIVGMRLVRSVRRAVRLALREEQWLQIHSA